MGNFVLMLSEVNKSIASMRITFLLRKSGQRKIQADDIDFFGDCGKCLVRILDLVAKFMIVFKIMNVL